MIAFIVRRLVRQDMGIDQPLPVQYMVRLGHVVRTNV